MRRSFLARCAAAGAFAVVTTVSLACASPAGAPASAQDPLPLRPTGARPALPQRSVAVRAELLHTMAGPPIEDGVVWIEDGWIRAVGPATEISLPDGIEILRARVATPGLVDAHGVVGLAGWLNQEQDKDEIDGSAPVQPELRAIDAYNPRDPLVEWVRSFGVTTVHTGHAPGALVPGQTMVVKTRGTTVEEAVVVPEAMVAAALGDGAQHGTGAPGTRAKSAAVLRQELLGARHYLDERARREAKESLGQDPDDGQDGDDGTDDETESGGAEDGSAEPKDGGDPAKRDLRKEALGRVLRGQTPLLLTAHRAHDIMTALRLAEEFEGLKLVLDGASEAPLVLEAIKAAGVSVIVHPTMQRTGGETDSLSFATPKLLLDAGVPTALQSGYEGYVPRTRVVLFEAAIAARYGLERERALGLVTRDAARVIGVLDRVGTLEAGKHGDVALYDGDPFEYTTHCTKVVIEGQVFDGEKPRIFDR